MTQAGSPWVPGGNASSWPSLPGNARLDRGAVHLFAFPLDVPQGVRRRLATLLSDDERARAARFVLDLHARRFVAAHAALRLVLARCLGTVPGSLAFASAGRGKPEVTGAPPGFSFNLTHSAAVGVAAVSWRGAVGVDVEPLGRHERVAGLLRRCFSEGEAAALGALAESDRPRALVAGWTRKEAYLKAIGRGLGAPMEQVETSLAPAEPPRILRVGWDDHEADRWRVTDIEPAPGYVGALVQEAPGGPVELWTCGLAPTEEGAW